MAEEKNNTSRFGSSILVPSVQELAKQPITEIPPRYIRPDLLHRFPIASAASEIPVIDMSNFHSDAELARLHSACKNWGFFQVDDLLSVSLCLINYTDLKIDLDF